MDVLDWTTQYELPLAGMLSVQLDAHTTLDASATPPWLVVHLHIAKNGGASKLCAALTAVANLHVLTSTTTSTTKKAALWTKVLTSSMMVLPLRPGDATLVRFTRFLFHSSSSTNKTSCGVPVLLDWTGMTVDTVAAPLLREFFQILTPHPDEKELVAPLTMGLAFTRCRLTATSIEILDAILHNAKLSANESLVDVGSLARLDLSDSGLKPDALVALAALLDRHDVRDLRLENALALANSDDTVRAVTAVLGSFCSPTTRHPSSVSLSLANNSLDPRYYHAIVTAFETTTRPLTRLSLARTMSVFNALDREACWTDLGYLMLSMRSDRDCDCELDLSGNPFYPQDLVCFREHVRWLQASHVEILRDALNRQRVVFCRLHATAKAYNGPTDDEEEDDTTVLDPTVLYQVHAISFNCFVSIVAREHTTTAPSSRWVKFEAIASLEIAGWTLARPHPRFTSLVLDDMRANAPLDHVLMVVGANLRRLSVRHVDVSDFVGRLLTLCPQLTHLDLEACRLTHIRDLTAAFEAGRARHLQSLNLNGNGVGVLSIARLVEIVRRLPGLPVRELHLKKCHIGTLGLTHVSELFQTSTSLEIVELDGGIRRGDNAIEDTDYATERERLTTRFDQTIVRVEPLPLRARLAVLSVSEITTLDTPVITLVLAYAATPVTRCVLWS